MDLLRGRALWLSTDEVQPRTPTANADGQLRRTGAASSLGGEEAFDDAVFERVVADHHQPPTRPQQGEGPGKPALERLELTVDRDAQGLEDPCRGMDPPAGRSRVRGRRGRHRPP